MTTTTPRKKKSTKSQPSNKTATKKTAKKKTAKKKSTTKVSTPQVLYEKVATRLCTGEKALTATAAKKILGWAAESDNVKYKSDYLLKDYFGKKVRCLNNPHNRPLNWGNVLQLKQEILRRKWKLNGEPIIVGKYGSVLNGQHTLIALVLAEQEWSEQGGQWIDYWQTEPIIDKLMVLGIDEDDDVVNTMDTCKPRTLSDVVFRSGLFNGKMSKKQRKELARMLEHAVKMMWHRTGASTDAFALRRTHSESIDFIERHRQLLDSVKLIHAENNKDSNLRKVMPPGYSSALLYLMACSKSDRDTYVSADHPSEDQLNFDLWDPACDFFTLLCQGATDLFPIVECIANLPEPSLAECTAVVIKGWLLWSQDKPLTVKAVKPSYSTNDDGQTVLNETPIVGGIDLGNP